MNTWNPIRWREMTKEEQESFPDRTMITDDPLPDSGEPVLVTVRWTHYKTGELHYSVEADAWDEEAGSWDRYDVELVLAWMPMPEAFREGAGMKIKRVTENEIVFDNGNLITYFHDQVCCEDNYADFSVLNENNIYYNHNFDAELQFEFVEDEGFTFGDEIAKIFIPCYSDQNGYYSTDIEILYNGKRVLYGNCKEAFY